MDNMDKLDDRHGVSRRDFLQRSVAAAAALAMPATVRGSSVVRPACPSIGVQLYSVRAAMQQDVDATLARVAGIGYRTVEFAGYFNRTAVQIRDSLRKAGLSAPSAHVQYSALGDEWSRVLDDAVTVGHRFVVVAWIDEAQRGTLDDWKRIAEQFNRAGERAAKAGITFAYHNHNFEFPIMDGTSPYDLLLTSTDPKLVSMEMDVYWVTKAGKDPLAYFARWPGRYKLLHLKDSSGPPDHQMADVGAGVINWKRLLKHHAQAGVQRCFVERDESPDPFASITASYKYLKKISA